MIVTYLKRILLILLGTFVSLFIIELLMYTFPQIVPFNVRVDPPVRALLQPVDRIMEWKKSDGDLFYWISDKIMPLSPNQDEILVRVHLITDEHGFRTPLVKEATYDVVALGDSFTIGSTAAQPWPEKLSEFTGFSVLNLGLTGHGPQQEIADLQNFGIEKQPRWVVMAYFEGNDLFDAEAYETATPFLVLRVGKAFVDRIRERINPNDTSGPDDLAQHTTDRFYPYPVSAVLAGETIPIAFFPVYISWLSVSRDVLNESRNMELVQELVLRGQYLSEQSGARFLLVNIPSKPHVYLRYIDAADLVILMSDVYSFVLDDDRYFRLSSQTTTPEFLFEHMDDQANLLRDFAAEHEIHFVDLTPYFVSAADKGEQLYYTYDTHWNQEGHVIAGRVIADFIQMIENES